jgi:hypothetical protein
MDKRHRLNFYLSPDGMTVPTPFLRALAALSASKSTRSQGAHTVSPWRPQSGPAPDC